MAAANAGPGIWVRGGVSTDPIEALVIQGNDIGSATVGNGVDGIRLDSSARQSVSGGIVEDNLLRNNGAHGIYNIGYATEDNELTRNDFADNGRCPLTMDAAARNDTWPAPEVVSFDSGSGIVELEHADADVADRIEVYWSSNIAVATFRGDATFVSGNTWTFDATGLGASSIDEFRAVAIAAADGETSEMTPRGGDGCSSLCPQPDPTNPCMVASFDGTQCQTVLRPTGYPCNDGDASTGSWRADDPSLELDHCVNTGATSTCTGGTPLTIDPVTFETDDCPLSSNCVTSYADPSTAACTYEAICGDGFCSPFDMDPDLQNGCGDRCTECQGLSMSDGDAIPDDWEVNLGAPWTRDWDCDGTPDADAYPPSGDAGQDELFLLLAWMAESCPDNTDANPNNDTNDTGFLQTMHHHKPHPSALAEVVQAFDNAGIDLEVELRCIPHYTQMHNSGGSNYDPDCNDLDEFIPFSQLKAKHFEPWRKGVYHFGVMGHGIAEKNINTSQQADGRCVSISQRSAAGETFGDDLRTYPEHGYDPKVDPPRANQNQRRLSETRSVMHELGHNLGLEHGGNGGKNKKPNYQSVMNYRYGAIREENGAAPFLDFSVVDDHALNESYLDEANGYESKVVTDLGLPPRLLSWTCPDGSPNFGWPQAANGLPRPIDWNCDGSTLQGATADIDGKSGLEVLTSHDDWFNLQMNMYCAGIPAWADTQTEYDPTRGVYTEQRWVDVDIAPSCPTNSLSVDDDFPVQAVLFGGPSLDVDELVASPRLGGATAARVHRSDVDGDGYDDLRAWFRPSSMSQMGISSTSLTFLALAEEGVLWFDFDDVAVDDYADSDDDGVIDPCDACPATGQGVAVGDDGCP